MFLWSLYTMSYLVSLFYISRLSLPTGRHIAISLFLYVLYVSPVVARIHWLAVSTFSRRAYLCILLNYCYFNFVRHALLETKIFLIIDERKMFHESALLNQKRDLLEQNHLVCWSFLFENLRILNAKKSLILQFFCIQKQIVKKVK